MPKAKIQNLITDLHEIIGDGTVSERQQQLLDEVQAHMHAIGTPDQSDTNMRDTLNYLLNDIESQHPKAAGVVREILAVLRNIGI